jgi:hypothetical protein
MKKNNLLQQLVRLLVISAIAGTFSLTAAAQYKVARTEREAAAQNANGTESGYASILIGLLRTQYAKVSVVNQGDKAIPVKLVFINDKGKVLILCNLIVESGKAVSETFQHPGGANRLEFYAQIRTEDDKNLKSLIPSVQIIDTETDRTDHFIGGSDFFAFRPIFNPPLVELPEFQ